MGCSSRYHPHAIVQSWVCLNLFLLVFCHGAQVSQAASLVGWGDNSYGQTNVPAGSDFVAIAAGDGFSVALRGDGTLAAWGRNNLGQTLVPIGNDFTAISAGRNHGLALRSNGSIVGWGENNFGKANAPAGSDFVAVAAGRDHSVALRNNGSLVHWGLHSPGSGSPDVTTVPSGNNFTAIAAGNDHSVAIKTDGTLVHWGYQFGGLRYVPSVSGFIAADLPTSIENYGLALRQDGSIEAWGDGYLNPNFEPFYLFPDTPAGDDFVAIAVGDFHNVALRADGSLVGWGLNWEFGYPGDVTQVPLGDTFVAIAAGSKHSIALQESSLILGDYNLDGIVDSADYTVWRDTDGQTGAALAADGDNSGTIDSGDYILWKANFGATNAAIITSTFVSTAGVPEPASVLLLCSAVVCLLLHNRCKSYY